MEDSLRLAWAAAKPIYESGEPERALMRSVAAIGRGEPGRLARVADCGVRLLGTLGLPPDTNLILQGDVVRSPLKSAVVRTYSISIVGFASLRSRYRSSHSRARTGIS
jgi:hypothetical protein